MLEESLLELETWGGQQNGTSVLPAAEDFLSLSAVDNAVDGKSHGAAKDEELKELQRKYEALQRVQKVAFDELYELKKDKDWFMKRERARQRRKVLKAKKLVGGGQADADGDVDMEDDESDSTDVGNTTNEESENGNEEEQSSDDDENASSSSEGSSSSAAQD
jgi:pre-rRNA-processing protein IPI3